MSKEYQHPKCYASDLGGCDTIISAEHYLSRSILELLNDGPGFNVSGFLRERQNIAASADPKSMVANILCKKHNEDLSTLDSEMLRFVESFDLMHAKLSSKSPSPDADYKFDGRLLERWVLKAISGWLASGNAAKNDIPIPKIKPSLVWLRLLYGFDQMPKGWGLYLRNRVGDRPLTQRGLYWAPLIKDGIPIGALFSVNDFHFLLAAGPLLTIDEGDFRENTIYRPSHFQFLHDKRSQGVRLTMDWRDSERHDGLNIVFHET